MSRRRKGPRLYLRERKGRKPEYVILDGTREVSTGCGKGDEQLARERLGEYWARHTRPETSQRDPFAIKIADVMFLYMKDIAPRTAVPALIGYHSVPLLRFFGSMNLGQINGATCRGYAESRGKEVSLSTVRRELTTLQAAINHWHRESPLAAVPKVVRPEEAPARVRFLSRTEAARMLWAARKLGFSHIARFILIGLYTGTRHDAILGLRWYPSEDSGWIDVGSGIIHRIGSGERRTKKRRTPARIPDRLMAHIRRWAHHDLSGGPQTAVVRWQGRPILKERRAWQRVVEAAKVDDVTPHTLKHTCITWLLNSGMPIWDISGLTATSVKTIETVYGHHSPEFQTEVAKAFRRQA